MRDFTLAVYKILLNKFLNKGYKFTSFENYILQHKINGKCVVLRHDVDRIPWNASNMAEIECILGIQSTYYFRVAAEAYNTEVIRKIVEMGHEVGYHYEDMNLAKGDIDKAYQLFEKHLNHFREFYPVKTICMHGSPLSKWDNRAIWEKYDYKKSNIIAEPYFDVDYDNVLYITDTGRKWNNAGVNIRDKVESRFSYTFKNTNSIMEMLEVGSLPDQLIINTHPHRWFNEKLPWLKELIYQSIKNQLKAILVKKQTIGRNDTEK